MRRSGDGDRERGRLRVGTDRAGVGFGFEHAVHAYGEMHLHGVGLFVGERLHSHDGVAVLDGLHAPVDARLAAGRDFDRPSTTRLTGRAIASISSTIRDRLGRFQMVMHIGREDDFVRARRIIAALHPQEQVFPS